MRSVCAIFVLTGVLAAGGGIMGGGVKALAETPNAKLEQNDPAHLRPKIRERLPVEVIPPRVRFNHPHRVYVFTDAITKVAKPDRTLSRLCQRGAFVQRMDGYYWAETPNQRLGVAFSGGANLSDSQNRRQPAEVYFFDGQDAVCTVYVAKQEAVMGNFTAPGSRLPVLGPAGIPAPAVQPSPATRPPPPPAGQTPPSAGQTPYR